jgi:predicted amidophosphoribosyltransferase
MNLRFCVVSRAPGSLRAASVAVVRPLGRIRDIALPNQCALCGNLSQKVLCAGCDEQYWNQTRTWCPVCALPMPVFAAVKGVKREARPPCRRCIAQPPHFDATIALADYHAPLGTLALDLKFHARRAIAEEFARQLQGAFEATDAALIERTRDTAPHAKLDLDTRRRNVGGAFKVQRELRGQHVAIVDDVMTSGATRDALAFTLKAAGARRVTNFVALRTPQD